MLNEILEGDNALLKIFISAVVVFGPLYLLSDMGYRWPGIVAMIILLGLFFNAFAEGRGFK